MAYQSKFMREQFGEEDQESVPQFQSRFMQQLAAQPYRTRGALPTQTREQANAYRDLLKSKGRESVLAPYRGTAGDSAPNNWKGFGVNDPDKGDWSEFGDKSPSQIAPADKQPQQTQRQPAVIQTEPVDLSKMSETQKIEYANNLLAQLNWESAPGPQQKDAVAQGAGGSFSGTSVGRKTVQALGEKAPSAKLIDTVGDFMTETLYGLSNGAADVLDFASDSQKVNNFLYSDFVKDNTMAGLSGFNRSVAQTADFMLPDVATVKPVQDVLNFYKSVGSGYDTRAAATNREIGMETAGSLFQSAVQAVPNAILAMMSGGTSEAAQLGGAFGSAASSVVQEAMKNPAFWASFMRTAGTSYEDAKAFGASELAATAYGIANGLISSGIEVGGGVEGMMDKNGLGGVLQTMYEEGSEEAKQNVIANLLAKILYNQDAEYFSMTDENAVFNPEREVKAFGGGAAIGGLFGGGNAILNSMRPTYDISQIYQYDTDSETGNSARPIATGTEATVPSMADMFTIDNKTPVQGEMDGLLDAFSSKTLTNAQIETLKPGGKNRAAFEEAIGMTLPETASKTRALLKLGAEESIDGTLKTEYNGVSGGVQNGTANPAGASVASGEGIPLEQQGFGSDSNVASGRQYTGGNRGTISVLNNNVNGGVQNEPTGAERVSGVFENTMPVGPGMGSGHGQPGELAGGNQVLYRVLNNDRTTSDALTRVGSAYTDLHDTTTQPQVFTAALGGAIKANKHGLMVSSKTPQELADSGAVTFMTNDGLAGAAVTADGDIEAVFKNPASQIKRASAPLMLNAIENGGRKLDCYGIDLVQNYNKFGFEPVARVAWNPEYAPDGWTYGPKDVYVMKLADGLDADGVKARLGFSESDGGFHKWTQPELDALPEMDYDAALDYRDSLLKQNARPTSTGTSNASTNIYDAGLTWPNALFPDVYTENTDMVGQQLPWENTVGAKQSEFPGKQGVSRVASNTYENTPLFTQAEKNAANLNAANSQYQYDIISEKQSLKEAAQRVAVDKAGEMSDLPTKEQFNGTDTDTAMLILQDEMKTAQETGDYSTVSRWAKMIQEKGTEAGQRIQAFAKYTRTPEGTVVKGERYVESQREAWEKKNPKQAEDIHNFVKDVESGAQEIAPQNEPEQANGTTPKAKPTQAQLDEQSNVDTFENDLAQLMDEDSFGSATDASARAKKLINEAAKKNNVSVKPNVVNQIAQQIVDGKMNARDAIDMLVEAESGIGRLEDADFKQIYDLMVQAMQYGENSRQRVDLEKQAYKVVADKTSATFMDKWDAWRYLAMLGNPKTHLRNTGGNGMFGEVVGVKDRIAGAIENALVRAGVDIDRTHSNLTPGDSQLVKASTADADEVYRILTGDGKYNPSRGIKEQQTVFKNKALETVRAWNNSALEAEDWFFLKQNYGRALAGYLKANGKDASVLSSNLDADVSFADKARAYAINEAQKSTFRDFSQFASNLSQVSQNLRDSGKVSGKIASMAIEGLVPFKKTPVNVLKRGVEYSPVSLATGLYDALVEVPKGRSTASQAIDKISAGLTGTGIMTLGAFLMSQGLLTVGPSGDDKEDDFKELQGVQNYALSIGGKSYTIDWAAPAALPLFVGAEIYDFYYGENSMDTSTFNKISTGLSRIGEPVLEMTMLQGLNDAIESTQYNDGDPLISLFTTAATSYATQGVPTLAGQIARSVDPIRRTSAADETGAAGSMERLFNRMENKIPGLSQTNQPYIDQWGRTQENVGGNFAGRLAYNMLSPGFYSENKPTQVDDWLSQLYERTGEKSVLPGSATRTVTIDGESRRLTGDEYTAYAQTRGQTAFDILEVLVPGYKDLTDEQAVHATEKAYTVAQEIAKQEALGIEPSKEVQNNIERAENWGDGDWMAGIADILKANALTYAVKGDLIPGAKDKYYDGSRKRNCIAALVDAGYSQQQAMQLYDLLNN